MVTQLYQLELFLISKKLIQKLFGVNIQLTSESVIALRLLIAFIKINLKICRQVLRIRKN